jgi:hypothetical protein
MAHCAQEVIFMGFVCTRSVRVRTQEFSASQQTDLLDERHNSAGKRITHDCQHLTKRVVGHTTHTSFILCTRIRLSGAGSTKQLSCRIHIQN